MFISLLIAIICVFVVASPFLLIYWIDSSRSREQWRKYWNNWFEILNFPEYICSQPDSKFKDALIRDWI